MTSAPYQHHSGTSYAAAVAIAPTADTLGAKVLAYLVEQGQRGATDDEMQEALAMEGSTQRPRRIRLQELNLIERTERKRPTRTGHPAYVYVVSDKPDTL